MLPKQSNLFDELLTNSSDQTAPDLGLQNHRFQSVAFHFKANAFYEWKTVFSYEIVAVANAE